MSPLPRRRGTPFAKPRPSYPKKGAVRRSQAVSTYGVGALVAVDKESFVVSDTSTWGVTNASRIAEGRLAAMLGVADFRLPPSGDDLRDGVHVRRFPLMHSCPECNELRAVRDFNSPAGRNQCGACEADLVPSRFVVVCPAGHLDDFPYWEWLHQGTDGHRDRAGCTMKLRTDGTTASLRSVRLSCDCGVDDVSMEGALAEKALVSARTGRCSGRQPWTAWADRNACEHNRRALQRGSSQVWQPVLRSALSIPPWTDQQWRRMDAAWGKIKEWPDEELDAKVAAYNDLSPEAPISVDAVRERRAAEAAPPEDDSPDVPLLVRTLRTLRAQEYKTLVTGQAEEGTDRDEDFVCEPADGDTGELEALSLQRPMLVKRLREVRALDAFTRGTMSETDLGLEVKVSRKDRWLPAMEVRGEGVFLRLASEHLRQWESREQVTERIGKLRERHEKHLGERTPDDPFPSPVTPRFVLLHTLAHVLITEWSLTGGYSVSALRERLYAGENMAGLLVYTATSDSEGSFGGLVAQGEPAPMAGILTSALTRAEWCAADPLCGETPASGVDGLNIVACHACLLLPETSCEERNCFLDRALLGGTSEQPGLGFFVTPQSA
ncbi:DUF1998 domain-containing protein [Streptomyces sp. SPB78]|uniref:DUF1998 domain-containing protein n=1 Tax=Streptomyces sp. (strain SPB78) TaxID=591157 RepID=UPI0001B57413|nr:DUF1998 domain-containing protein [Streptomyces sp. SPB78]